MTGSSGASSTPRPSRNPTGATEYWIIRFRAFADDDGTSALSAAPVPSRHCKAKRLAATRHIDGGKAADREPAGAAVALFIDFELALTGAKLGSAAPIHWLVPELKRAIIGIDRFRKTEDAPGLTDDTGMQ